MRTSMRRTWRSYATPSRRTSKWGARLIWLGPLEFTLGLGSSGLPHPEKGPALGLGFRGRLQSGISENLPHGSGKGYRTGACTECPLNPLPLGLVLAYRA
jgi:hypothetical protein